MSKIGYKQAREDHEYLWSIAPAYDMTGGYGDQEDLDRLLRTPTTKTATTAYNDQIRYWFDVGPDEPDRRERLAFYLRNDQQVKDIAIRHGLVDEYDEEIDNG